MGRLRGPTLHIGEEACCTSCLSGNAIESLLIGHLSYLCEEIVANLKILKPLNCDDFASDDGEDSSRKLSLPEATLKELLRKCLFLFSHTNNQLMNSISYQVK